MHIDVTLPEIPVDQRSELVKNLTETIGNVLDLPMEVRKNISIRLEMYGKNQVARGGTLVANNGVGLYHMDVYAPTLHLEQKRNLIRYMTEAFCDTVKMRGDQKEHVFVTVYEFSPENVGTGGRLLAEAVMV